MKKITITLIMTIIFCIIIIPKSQAALQAANKNGGIAKDVAVFFKEIRNMETTNGALKIESNIQATSYLDTSGNGIDCHMAKNTEWGTVALLSASKYGAAPNGSSSASTTGNNTGIFQMADSSGEFVGAIYGNASNDMKAADARYINNYKTLNSITGDAMGETNGWKGATRYNLTEHSSYGRFVRGEYSLFNYFNTYTGNYVSRAVVVCGEGL